MQCDDILDNNKLVMTNKFVAKGENPPMELNMSFEKRMQHVSRIK